MSQLHTLPSSPRPRPQDSDPDAAGEIVALPFIDLETVLKTMKMLRGFPDQSVLDQFNRVEQG